MTRERVSIPAKDEMRILVPTITARDRRILWIRKDYAREYSIRKAC